MTIDRGQLTMTKCKWCGSYMKDSRVDRETCSSRCRQAFYQWRRKMRNKHQQVKKLIAEIAQYLEHEQAKMEAIETLKDVCKVVHDESEKRNVRFIRMV